MIRRVHDWGRGIYVRIDALGGGTVQRRRITKRCGELCASVVGGVEQAARVVEANEVKYVLLNGETRGECKRATRYQHTPAES